MAAILGVPRSRMFVWCLSVVMVATLAACGGDDEGGGSNNGSGGSSGTGSAGGNTGGTNDGTSGGNTGGNTGGSGSAPAALGGDKGVTGTVNGAQQKVTGVTVNASLNSVTKLVAIQGLAPMEDFRWLLNVPDKVGSYECNVAAGVLIEYSKMRSVNAWITANKAGTCTITVNQVTASSVSGTFVATLGPGDSNSDKTRRTVTNGAFHVDLTK